MPESGLFLNHKGPIDYEVIESVLMKFKKKQDSLTPDRMVSKRVYAILVECLENIVRHSAGDSASAGTLQPYLSVIKEDKEIIIRTGNLVANEKTDRLTARIEQVNKLDRNALVSLFEREINREPGKDENGTGLGLILMKLKTGKKFEYTIRKINNAASYFEMEIILNRYAMRKLIIDQTTNSPKVILDPESRVFEISGESRPPDANAFYDEILRWLEQYSSYLERSEEREDAAIFNLDFEYFNSSSAKCILDFCKKLAAIRSQGVNIGIKWHYGEDDMDMFETGREMSGMLKLPFEYVRKNS